MFLLLLLYAISASTCVLSKSLLVYCSPLLLTGLRTLIAGILFVIYAWSGCRLSAWRGYITPCVLVGLSSFYLSNTLKFWALRTVSCQQASCIFLIEPLCAAVFAYVLCNERMTYSLFVGLLLCSTGAYVGSYDSMTLPACSLATGALLCSVIASSFGALLMRVYIRMHGANVSVINGLSMLCAGLLASITAYFIECDVIAQLVQAPMLFWIMLACMILLSNLLAYSMYGVMVKQHSAVLISSVALLRPICIVLYNGAIGMQQVASAAIIFTGLLIMYQEETKSKVVYYKDNLLKPILSILSK